MNELFNEYIQTVIKRLAYYKQLADRTFEQLEDGDFHMLPGSESNSIAIIIQHVSGNMLSRWTNFLSEDGEKTWRDRDAEFEPHGYSREKLLEVWEQGWGCFLSALKSLKAEDLLKTVQIRKESLSVLDAVNRQLAHYPYHVGQIVYLGRLIKNEAWKNLSIPKGQSGRFNNSEGKKDPASSLS